MGEIMIESNNVEGFEINWEEKAKSLQVLNAKLSHKLEIALEGLRIISEDGDVGNISTKTIEAVNQQQE